MLYDLYSQDAGALNYRYERLLAEAEKHRIISNARYPGSVQRLPQSLVGWYAAIKKIRGRG